MASPRSSARGEQAEDKAEPEPEPRAGRAGARAGAGARAAGAGARARAGAREGAGARSRRRRAGTTPRHQADRRGHGGRAARARRERHRGHRHPLAQAVGDEVAVDEPLLEISTDKVDTEIPSPVAGTLAGDQGRRGRDRRGRRRARHHRRGRIVGPRREGAREAGAREAKAEPEKRTRAGAEKSPSRSRSRRRSRSPSRPRRSAAPPEPEKAPTPPPAAVTGTSALPTTGASGAATQGGGDTYVTPIVRKLAKQHGVDLAAVTGTGVGGRIRKQDVLDAAEKAPGSSVGAGASACRGSRLPCAARPRS